MSYVCPTIFCHSHSSAAPVNFRSNLSSSSRPPRVLNGKYFRHRSLIQSPQCRSNDASIRWPSLRDSGDRSLMQNARFGKDDASSRSRAAASDLPSAIITDVSDSQSGFPSPDIMEVWKSAEAVCFDVDSTVCLDEGIDELAAFCGAGEEVAAWTARAMGGAVPFEVALGSRLDLFKPSASTVANFVGSRPPRLSPGIAELVRKLHDRGTDVYLVSGGFRQMIEPVAELLQIGNERIFANTLLFKEDGSFAGFDDKEPTSRSGGKATAIEKIKHEHGYKKLVMIGDGATDLEARRPGGAEIFICYGGVVSRPKVVAGSDWFVSSFTDLIKLA